MRSTTTLATPAQTSLLWDVFCHVVDNLGDIGVCWRLSADLASRGHRVRLWIDQPEPLRWMAPGALEGRWHGVTVMAWTPDLSPEDCSALPAADVWVETFGCDPPPAMVRALAQRLTAGAAAPVWINLEYLSAEHYVERSHRLPSPVMSGPLKGLTKWFFFPGFTPATGGLLREPGLMQCLAGFDRAAWLLRLGQAPAKLSTNARLHVTVFCYGTAPLDALLRLADTDTCHVQWLVPPGVSAQAMRQACADPAIGARVHRVELPTLPQSEFDALLWASDLNLVRGEDSLVRALWAGQAFVWNIYPQHDDAHHGKLEAFLDWLDAPESLRRFHRAWNGIDGPALPLRAWPGWPVVLQEWRSCVLAARMRLLAQPDLTTQLLELVAEKR